MEIQAFLLCKQLQKAGQGNEWNAGLICLHSFFAVDGNYPLNFKMPYYALLRREQRLGDEEISLRFNLVDEDGSKIGLPADVAAKGIFPTGHMFMSLHGTIEFSFPKIGDYRLDITADEGKLPSVYSYNIEITEKP